MRIQRTAALFLAAAAFVFLLAGCGAPQQTPAEDSTVSEQMYEIHADDPFA